jgi:hypothetical protein
VSLPAIRSARGLFFAACTTVLISAVMYYAPQRWPLFTPALLPLTALDLAIPFWPLTGTVYFAVFPFLLATFVLLRERAQATRFLCASLLAQTVGMIAFLLWPTAYPRDLYPLPPDAGALATALVHFCRGSDLPVNCLPSLHVSTVTLCVCALRGSRLFVPAVWLSVPLALSTLTFKQHYAVDVVAGLTLGLFSWRISQR